jgi:hypothetical protein
MRHAAWCWAEGVSRAGGSLGATSSPKKPVERGLHLVDGGVRGRHWKVVACVGSLLVWWCLVALDEARAITSMFRAMFRVCVQHSAGGRGAEGSTSSSVQVFQEHRTVSHSCTMALMFMHNSVQHTVRVVGSGRCRCRVWACSVWSVRPLHIAVSSLLIRAV